MIYKDCKINGPYKRKDGRMHMVLTYEDRQTTVSYPKYLIEIKLGRYLKNDETVDHKDIDFTNNDYDNLQILTRKEHCSLDAITYAPESFICPIYEKQFILEGLKLRCASRSTNEGRAGPFCSKSCAGKYGASIQNGGSKLKAVPIKLYYTTKKCLNAGVA